MLNQEERVCLQVKTMSLDNITAKKYTVQIPMELKIVEQNKRAKVTSRPKPFF